MATREMMITGKTREYVVGGASGAGVRGVVRRRM
jgi:hypothetical protein